MHNKDKELSINRQRLRDDINALAGIGRNGHLGRHLGSGQGIWQEFLL